MLKEKKMKRIIILAMCLLSAFSGAMVTKASESIEFYNMIAENLEIIQVYDTDDLDYNILVNRDGKIIIEKTIGRVENSDGDGKIINTKSRNNYISYKYVEDAEVGDIILTYCIYNPDTEYEDDIIARFDYIIDRPIAK